MRSIASTIREPVLPSLGAVVNGSLGIAHNMAGFYVFREGVAANLGLVATTIPEPAIDRVGSPTWDAQGGREGAGVTATADYFETFSQGPAPAIPGSGGGVSFIVCLLTTTASSDFHVWSNRHSTSAYTGVSLRTLSSGANWRAQFGSGSGFLSGNRRSIDSSIAVVTNQVVVVGATLRGSTDMSLYVNGRKDTGTSYSGTGGSINNGTNLPMHFGGNGQNVNGVPGKIFWVAFWNRNMTDEEHMQFYLDPFACLARSQPIQIPRISITTDAATVLLDLQPSGTDVGPYTDEATAFVDLQPSGVDEFAGTTFDAGTAFVDLLPSGGDTAQFIDSGTLLLDLQPEACEIFVPRSQEFVIFGEERWETQFESRFVPVGTERWEVGLVEIGDIAECQ